MMNYIWGFMLIAGIVVSLATGRADAFTDSFLARSDEDRRRVRAHRSCCKGPPAHPYFSLSQRKKQPDAGHDDHELYGKHLRSRKQRHRIFPQSHGEARC